MRPQIDESEADQQDFERIWHDPPGLLGQLAAVQNTPIGMRFIVTAFGFFIVGGILALLMRIQLAVPENSFLGPEAYNQVFTMHGSTMMFLFAVPLIEGIGALVLPQMLGGRELPYPRLSAFAYWTTLFGGVIFYLSFLIGAAPDGGWFAYVPLTGPEFSPGKGMDFWLLGLNVAEIGAIAGAIEIIISVLRLRAPGMTLSRIPLFAWAMLVTAFMMIFAFTPLIVSSTLLELDRKLGTQFFDPSAGGDPLLWQHLFWFFGHPDVYIQFLPAVGIVSTIIPVFVRRPIAGYPFVAFAIVAIGFLSFGLWVHHMFSAGLPQAALAIFSAASMTIAIPSGLQIFAWLATIWNGRPVWKTPFLFAIGFIVTFVLGGLTGVMVASAPFDWQVHDSYFVVAHFHYVLIGGVVFPIFAAIYFWAPKFVGRLLDERLGQLNFWLLFVGFNVTFFPMHITGLLGMPRRVYTYPTGLGWEVFNLISTIGAFIVALGILVFLANFIWSLRHGATAGDNPWGADTLEWATNSPPPQYGFRRLPIVRSRNPLWDQENLRAGEERTVKLLDALAQWPRRYRSQIVTSTLDAVPEEVFRVPGPSLWPLILSLGVTGLSVAFIFDSLLGTVVSTIVSVVALIGWHWPDDLEMAGDTAEEDAFEQTHNIPVLIRGSAIIARWAMLLAIMTLGIALATLLFCYFYLRLVAPQWPPGGITPPSLLLPGIETALLIAGAVPLAWAARSMRQGRGDQFKAGLTGGLVLYVGAIGLAVVDFGQISDVQTHAYGSLFFVIVGFHLLVVVAGLVMNVIARAWTWRLNYGARYRQRIENLALYGYYVAIEAALIFVTLYLSPYV
ncbi:MAG TPA: cytochrome c oxidase subunit I [Roseiflexaceae bacterium]|nr:cytochrome c oxidase subunit I [Roseiflexaceae bacterium]